MLRSEIMRTSILFIVMISLTSIACCQDLLAPGETRTYMANYTVKEADICSCIENNVAAIAIDPCNKSVDSASNSTVKIVYDANITLYKTSDKDKVKVFPGDTINYAFYVENTGDVNLTNVSLEDVMIKDTRYISGDENGDRVLNPDEVWIYKGSYTVVQRDLCDDIVNTAIVRATDPCRKEIERTASDTVKTICITTVCCPEGETLENIDLGDQRAVGMHNSQAENTVKIVSSQENG